MKRVLITGATSGIGLELAQEYALQGWHVFACGRNTQTLANFSQQFEHSTLLSFDVTNKQETLNHLVSIEHEFDLIILNAGTCEYIEKGQIDSSLFQRVFSANFFGVLHCIEALQTHFSNKTHLALMGSIASYLPLPRSEAYGASKAAIAYLAHSLAADLAPRGVTVSLISPGFVQTPLTNKNDFPMPMIISAQKAAQIIYKELEQKKVNIHFPKKFTYSLKLLSILPIKLQRYLMAKLSRKNQ